MTRLLIRETICIAHIPKKLTVRSEEFGMANNSGIRYGTALGGGSSKEGTVFGVML
jgi:hypothetical protein